MHDDFADWYRLTTTGSDAHLQADHLDRRWQGVEAAVKALKSGDELDLVRVLTGRNPVGKDFVGTFRGAFKAADPTFSMHGNDLEVRVLAGSTLAHLTEEKSASVAADRAALALACATALAAADARPWLPPFVELAESYLEERSREVRRRVSVTLPKFDPGGLQASFDAFAESFATQEWTGKIPTTAKAAFAALSDAVGKFSRSASQALSTLSWQEERRREESDVLWWVIAEYSRDLDRRMADVKLPGAAVVAGKELADLVSLPGPLAAKSFLDKVLSTCGTKTGYRKPIGLAAAVAGTPRDWRATLGKRDGVEKVHDLTPALGAVRHSLTTDGEDEWVPAYKKAYGLDPSVEAAPTDLAVIAYRECLLARAAQ